MNNQGIYQATLFAAIAQSNIVPVAFGFWLAIGADESEPVAAALVFTFWMGVSWWVWRWARKRFWPEEFDRARDSLSRLVYFQALTPQVRKSNCLSRL